MKDHVTQKELADARTEDRHYGMQQLTLYTFPINETLSELRDSSIRQDESIKNFEKRFEYHMEKEEKDRSEIVTDLKEILMKIDSKESKRNVWAYLGVLSTIACICFWFFYQLSEKNDTRDSRQDIQIQDLRERTQRIEDSNLRIEKGVEQTNWSLQNRFK